MPADEVQLPVARRGYCIILLCAVIGFITIHCALTYYHYEITEVPWLVRQLFDLDEENNLPTWFSSFLLLNNALLLFVRAQFSKNDNYYAWLWLAIGFLVLSIDEVAGLHESLNTAIDTNWAIPGGILVILTGLAFIPFLLSLPRRIALLFICSGLIYVSGAIGVELLSEDMDEESMAYGFATALEEGMEMLGAYLFLVINLSELKGQQLKLTFSNR